MHEQLNLLNADLDSIIDASAAEPNPQEQADEAAPRPKYYPIDENMARRAHEMMSMRDYPENRATNEYRASVDKAARRPPAPTTTTSWTRFSTATPAAWPSGRTTTTATGPAAPACWFPAAPTSP